MNRTVVLRCSGGLDRSSDWGRCVAKPVPPPAESPCQRCISCLTSAQGMVAAAVAAATASSTSLGDAFYTWCSGRGYALSSCRDVKAAVAASYGGNLARRAGALCTRLGAEAGCSAVADDATCAPSLASFSANATTLKGALDACTLEGISGGSQVSGSYSGTGEGRRLRAVGEGRLLICCCTASSEQFITPPPATPWPQACPQTRACWTRTAL
jgi:hypothetical protein